MRFGTPSGPVGIDIVQLTVAGWTGRDAVGLRHHIEELAAIGVAPPSSVPLYYRVAASLLTRADAIEVLGEDTSGEVEPLLLRTAEGLWLGLGSDHTDRGLEATSVAASKQACAKPVAETLWPWDEVSGHLDRIALRSWIEVGPTGGGAADGGPARTGETWIPYQDGTLAAIRPLSDLARASGLANAPLTAGTGRAMLCGTVPVGAGGIRPARAFRMELADPVIGRTISHRYRIAPLPVIR